MFLRFQRIKRALFFVIISCTVFLTLLILFGDVRTPKLAQLTDLAKCPACFGVSLCPELYTGALYLDESPSLSHLLNAKNIYRGMTKSGRRVVLKKLAHDWEWKKFDREVCNMLNEMEGCSFEGLLNITDFTRKTQKLVEFLPGNNQLNTDSSFTLCPYAHTLPVFMDPFFAENDIRKSKNVFAYVWTMFKLNPEPIILKQLDKNVGWPVAQALGACGRIWAVWDAGNSLASASLTWPNKLHVALQILYAAEDFTFKHEKFRFYLTDWSLDNIVVDETNTITFVDLENVIVLDKATNPGMEVPHWYEPHVRDASLGGFSFSTEDICQHHLSDHNIWAACYILAGEEQPLLVPIPKSENGTRLLSLLQKCLVDKDKFAVAKELRSVLKNMIEAHKKPRHYDV